MSLRFYFEKKKRNKTRQTFIVIQFKTILATLSFVSEMKACYGEQNVSFDSATSPSENSITILPVNSTQSQEANNGEIPVTSLTKKGVQLAIYFTCLYMKSRLHWNDDRYKKDEEMRWSQLYYFTGNKNSFCATKTFFEDYSVYVILVLTRSKLYWLHSALISCHRRHRKGAVFCGLLQDIGRSSAKQYQPRIQVGKRCWLYVVFPQQFLELTAFTLICLTAE